MIVYGYLASILYGVLCMVIAAVAYKLGMPKIYTRKIVHILVGFEWVILYHLFGVGIHFVAVALAFTSFLLISYKMNMMPMMSSESENSPGTVYYGISMSLMAIISCFVTDFVFAFGIAVFCTSVGDGFAAVIGSSVKRVNPKIYKNKTFVGTFAAFVFSFASTVVFSLVYKLPLEVWECALIALFAAGIEIVTGFGLDNITLPLGTALLSYLILYVDGVGIYLVPIVLTPYIVAIALEKHILTVRGVVFALVCDVLVSLSLGNFGFVLLLAFLLLSVAVDKIKKRLRKAPDEISKRGEHRDEVQVMANGIIPVIMSVCYFITAEPVFVIAYNVALAECFADTCASGLGSLSKGAFDPFRMKKVPVGLSGGMSVIGTLCSIIAPFGFLLISLAFGAVDIKTWVFCSLIAALGAIFDSFLGSVLQAKYKCPACGIITEKTAHCEQQTELVCGKRFITNDVVNLVSCAFAAALSAVIYIFVLM